jgi:hypothetical protein
MIITFIKDRKGIQKDLKNIYGNFLTSISGFTSTPMQPMTYKELSCGFIVE